jgi:hypothetical protein
MGLEDTSEHSVTSSLDKYRAEQAAGNLYVLHNRRPGKPQIYFSKFIKKLFLIMYPFMAHLFMGRKQYLQRKNNIRSDG